MNKVFTRILGYVKSHLILVIAYSISAVAMLIVSMCLLSWALSGGVEQTVSVKKASLVAVDADNAPTLHEEYIVGQQFDTRGWALKFAGKTVMLNADDIYKKYVTDVAEKQNITVGTEAFDKLTAGGSKYAKAMAQLDKVSINTEFNAAYENKRAQIIYRQSDYVSYVAQIEGKALFVRTVEVESYPEYIDMSGDKPVIDDGFVLTAVLGNKPETDSFGEYEEVRGGWRVSLDEHMYTVSTVSDTSLDDFYTISFFCGDVSTEFSFYNAAGKSFIVSSKNNIVKYSTDSDDRALTLVVTERDDSYQLDCTGTSEGSYIYTRGDVSTVYDFAYELNGKDEVFNSSENIDEAHGNGTYTATVDGTEFTANADVWQGAVVNGIIVDDHGFKAVIESAKRILEFDRIMPMFTLDGEDESWSDGGVEIQAYAPKLSINDNGRWTISVAYKPSNGEESAVTVEGSEWLFDGEDIILVVPDYEKSKTNGETALHVSVEAGDSIALSSQIDIAFEYSNSSSVHAIEFSSEAQNATVAELVGSVEVGFQTLYGKLVATKDLAWKLFTGGDEGSLDEVASGYWHKSNGDIVLTVVSDENNVVYVPDAEEGEVKTVTIDCSATRGKFTYSLELNYAHTADGEQAPTYVKLPLSGSSEENIMPSLTLYVSEYSMNPLLGTGNGYSRGVYIYTDASGKSFNITFYLQAWVWTYVPLSSSHGDVYAEASVNDYVKDNEGNWNTFRRGTMYADISFFERGVGFVTESFSAPEERWLNALLNL